MALVYLRCLVVLLCALAALILCPFGFASFSPTGALTANALFGAAAGGIAILLEILLRRQPLRIIAGGLAGLFIGAFVVQVLAHTLAPGLRLAAWPASPDLTSPVMTLAVALAGCLIGSQKASTFRADRLISMFRAQDEWRNHKILDTSVIIDGRIADICETGFMEGTLLVPQFVLRELQTVADSSDPLKRNRGRKGLDILQRMKKNANVTVLIPETDFPDVRDVDQKLIELARQVGAKIVTNDFNLNKVAQLRGLEVLNINELANSLKPVVLPGESMKVFIIKEGKEMNQGVAYLDDGTMVVVDSARKHIGRTVEISVTSVLQTTAGKMFFGRVTQEGDKTLARRAPRDAKDPADPPGPAPEHEAP
ncbi:MAG: PIN/TRAM domain-containing protein [Candidatus Polarisedimenticolia bacterium]